MVPTCHIKEASSSAFGFIGRALAYKHTNKRKDSHNRRLEMQSLVIAHERYRKGIYMKKSSWLVEKESNIPARIIRGKKTKLNKDN